MKVFKEIINRSSLVDLFWKDLKFFENTEITYLVPSNHLRYLNIKKYFLSQSSLVISEFQNDSLFIVDSFFSNFNFNTNKVLFLEPKEDTLKEISNLEVILTKIDYKYKNIVAMGGGIILNIALYIAEKTKSNIILVPTTVISMSDSSIGGKVRVNKIHNNIFTKHFYKSFYEPNKILLDEMFLDFLSDEQIKFGLAEVVKHAIYQSEGLLNYILSDGFSPFLDRKSLLKSILWTADLKRICLEVDPDEHEDGSYKILRAAHDISDKIEEKSGFKITHGEAVIKAMYIDLKDDIRLKYLLDIYKKLNINFELFSF
jgi:3-dehydroquinate synthetase